MIDEHYINPRLAAIYDINCGWSADRDFYLRLPASGPQRILDLGCGTGLLADAFAARGHLVTGVDPAPAMLDVARKKRFGSEIEWVLSAAEDYRSGARYDLIISTGHAFQVLLDDAAVAKTFAMVARNLAAGGRFVFESRNPAVDWANRWDYAVNEADAAGQAITETRTFLGREGEFVRFEQQFVFPDETLVSTSTLRFMDRPAIEAHLAAAGLRVEAVLGDWQGAAFDGTQDEMIFLVRAA